MALAGRPWGIGLITARAFRREEVCLHVPSMDLSAGQCERDGRAGGRLRKGN